MCEKIYEEVRSFILVSSEQNFSLFKISCLKYFVRALGQEVSINNRHKWHCTDSIDYRTYEEIIKLYKPTPTPPPNLDLSLDCQTPSQRVWMGDVFQDLYKSSFILFSLTSPVCSIPFCINNMDRIHSLKALENEHKYYTLNCNFFYTSYNWNEII